MQKSERLANRDPDEIGKPVILDGVEFLDAEIAQAFSDRQADERIWPWISWFPAPLTILLGAAAFGALGGVGRLLKEIVLDGKNWKDVRTVATPLFGSVLAIVLLLLSYVVPLGLTTSEDIALRPLSVVIISLLGGMFSDRAYAWVERQAGNVFAERNNK
jgi:hypothetical protein